MEELVDVASSLLPNPVLKKKKKRSTSRRKGTRKKKRPTTDIDHLMAAENESPEAVLKEFVESFYQQSRYLQKEFIEKQYKAMKKRLGDGENPLLQQTYKCEDRPEAPQVRPKKAVHCGTKVQFDVSRFNFQSSDMSLAADS